MDRSRIVDVTDAETFGLVAPCADPGFDHRSCDYWEDADRGSKAARLSWFDPAARPARAAPARPRNLFGEVAPERVVNPFVPATAATTSRNPFLFDDEPASDNPFAARRPARPTVGADAPRKLGLLGRGLGIFGSYAQVLLVDDLPVAYAQFGPLSAYPRALRLRQLYPQLPDAPLPAVITCVATIATARGVGHATRLVRSVCEDLAGRGFAAVEAYPEAGTRPDATSGATPAFWIAAGFYLAVDDERFPVVRRELG
jgi:hypothetical protein